jgi:hypothetical protein
VVENINGSFTEFKASHRTSKEIAIVDGTVSVKTFAVAEDGFHILNGKYLDRPTRKHRKRVRHSGFNDHPVNNDAIAGMPIVNRVSGKSSQGNTIDHDLKKAGVFP